MTYNQYEKILVSISSLVTEEEKIDFLQFELEKWRGINERTDDILMIGFQVI